VFTAQYSLAVESSHEVLRDGQLEAQGLAACAYGVMQSANAVRNVARIILPAAPVKFSLGSVNRSRATPRM
jgi:hypothetical protein